MPESLKKSVKCRVPVDGRGPTAFGTEWVKISLGEDSHESTRTETHPSTKFMKISSNLGPVDVIYEGKTKGKAPDKQLVLVLRKRESA